MRLIKSLNFKIHGKRVNMFIFHYAVDDSGKRSYALGFSESNLWVYANSVDVLELWFKAFRRGMSFYKNFNYDDILKSTEGSIIKI